MSLFIVILLALLLHKFSLVVEGAEEIRSKLIVILLPSVQEVVDRYHNLIKKSFEEFGISFDIYSRTTSKIHNKFASDFFRTLYDNNKLVEKTEEQFCDEVTGEFLTDRNIVGTCPRCALPAFSGADSAHAAARKAHTATNVRNAAQRSRLKNSSTRPTKTIRDTDW